MKYSISQAARIAAVTRKTFYKHIDKKGITVEKDNDGNPLVDASELIRVYGDKCQFDTDEKQQETPTSKHKETELSTSEAVEIAVLQERIKHLQEQKEHFEELYQQERTERQAGTLQLTDQRSKQEKWESTFNELQSQMFSHQNLADQELREFKEETKRKLILYKRALMAERNKTFWEKMFSRKKGSHKGK